MTLTPTFPTAIEEDTFQETRRTVKRDFFPPTVVNDVLAIYEASEAQLVQIILELSDESVAEALLQAAPIIDRIVRPSRKLLEIDEDPDTGPRKLFCVLRVAAGPEAAVALLHALDADWYLRQSPELRRRLNFTLELEDDGQV